MGGEINFWGGVSGLTLMLSERGRTMGWCCPAEYSVLLKKMLVIAVLTFLNRVFGRTKNNEL